MHGSLGLVVKFSGRRRQEWLHIVNRTDYHVCIFNLLVFVVCIQVSCIINKVVHRSKVKVIISRNRMNTVLFSCYLIYALPCLYHAFLIICDFNPLSPVCIALTTLLLISCLFVHHRGCDYSTFISHDTLQSCR